MLVVAPDAARLIDLPGVGPCPRPIDLDRGNSGLAVLVSLRVYAFAAEAVVDGEAEADELFIVVMRGRAALAVDQDGGRALDATLDAATGPRAAYLPPHAAYRLSAATACDVAYARARPAAARFGEPAAFAPAGGALRVERHAAGMTLTLERPAAGEAVPLGAPAPGAEAFAHVRGHDVRLDDRPLTDGAAVALRAGEAAMLQVGDETTELLLITATTT